MIKDELKNHKHFLKIRPDFLKAFEFLSRKDLEDFPDGSYELDGRRVFAVISHGAGRGVKKAKLEAHRRYIDIQYVVSGRELMGVSRARDCRYKLKKYDPEKDIMFFADVPEKYLKLKAGEFVILFPDDAHAPLAGRTPVHKAVVKVIVR